jgi:hypothetical protein
MTRVVVVPSVKYIPNKCIQRLPVGESLSREGFYKDFVAVLRRLVTERCGESAMMRVLS